MSEFLIPQDNEIFASDLLSTQSHALTALRSTFSGHADEADYAKEANHAIWAEHAKEANHSKEADNALNSKEAEHAKEADHSKNADNAINAQYATNAAHAPTSSKWSSARTISLVGDVTGSGVIDGSKNVTIDTYVKNDFIPNPNGSGKFYDLDGHLPLRAPGLSSEKYLYDIHYAILVAGYGDFSPVEYFGHQTFIGNGGEYLTVPPRITEYQQNSGISAVVQIEGFMLKL